MHVCAKLGDSTSKRSRVIRAAYFVVDDRGRSGEGVGGRTMASEERESKTGVWGRNPQRGPGAEPLMGGQGDEAP